MAEENLIKQLRHTLARMESALGAVNEGLVFTDQNGVVEWTNGAFERFVGRNRLHCLGRPLSDLLPTRYQDGKIIPKDCLEFWTHFFPGHALWELSDSPPRQVMEVTWATVNSGNASSLVFTFKDQSAITQAQDKLIEARDLLELKVQQRTQQLQEARDEAVAANQAKTRFLANMSHDIRTPLNAILGMMDLLDDGRLDNEQKEMVSTIQTSGKHLLALINDVLDIAQIETGFSKLNEATFSLAALLQACVAQFEPEARRKGIQLVVQVPTGGANWLRGDELKLCQIMNNLLGNALKYTAQGSIRVAAEMATTSVGRITVKIQVRDTGIGIDDDALPKIFEEFARFRPSRPSKDAKESIESNGLGLAICARLCKLMGGTISARSEPGQGSCFTVEIPFASTEDPSLQPVPGMETTRQDHGLRILIADDNRVNQRVLQLMLQRLGFQAQLANDGLEAVEQIREDRGIDLVFMDLEMPRLDGLAASRLLRAEGHQHPYIIALTAYSFDSQRRDCQEAGMNDFLTKPLQKDALSEALQRFQTWQQTTGPDARSS